MQNPAETTSNEFISDRLTPIQQVQLQLGLNALVQEDVNLAVRCTTGAQSQAAAQWLQAMLTHRLPNSAVKVCGLHEGHRLIEAFNQALTPQTLSQAHQAGALTPSQLWLVREDCFERPADLTLMARLLQTFPGTPIRVIFLLAAATGLPAVASGERSHIQVITLDDRRPEHMGQPAVPVATLRSEDHAVETGAAAAPQAPDLSDVVPGDGHSPAAALTASSPNNRRLVLGVSLATALVGGLTWWSQHASSQGAATEPVHESAQAAASQTTASEPLQASPPASSPGTAAPAASAASGTSQGMAAPSAASASSPASSSASPPATAPLQATWPAAVQSAHRWLSRLPEGALVIEHGRYESLAAAQRSTRGQAHLKEARILAVKEGEQTRYLVVTGPFRSADRVQHHMRRLQLNKAQSHPVSALRSQLLAP